MISHKSAQIVRVVIGVILVVGVVTALSQMKAANGQPAPLLPLGIEMTGPKEWLSDSPAAVRVVVTDHSAGRPAPRARVVISLLTTQDETVDVLYRGRTDGRGTLRAAFDIPAVDPGAYRIAASARTGDLSDRVVQDVRIKRASQILLTTDKPIYQPSQTMHIRALALRRPDLRADAGQHLTLEVADAKGNKVFKKTSKTNDFGIASTDFELADEVNMGRYTIRAIVGEDEAEKTVTVKRYVLPKFKVQVSTDRSYYLPGDSVEGKVQADYFFGKPVSDGQVNISVKTFDVEFTEVRKVEGSTDDGGSFTFECTLSDHFVGQPLEQGKAFLQFEVKVTDQADHTEQAIHTASVAAGHLGINAVAEAGELVPGVENIIYVMTSRPTGEPVSATVRVESAKTDAGPVPLERTDYRTDELGIAEVALTPQVQAADPAAAPPNMGFVGMGGRMGPQAEDAGPNMTLQLAARLPDGTVTEKTVQIGQRPGTTDNLLLRVDRPLAKVGDVVNASALCAAKSGSVFFDIVKDRQTVLTQAADIRDGRASLDLRLTPDITGSIYLSAYRIMPSGQIVRDTRPMFVEPANDLAISVDADKETYLPGGDTKLTFAVRDADGNPVAAALGINVVDESVFALQELQPGMEKVFFYLEQELMKPRYEIHGLELPTIITTHPDDMPVTRRAEAERAAKVVFAGVKVPDLDLFQVNSYADRVGKAKEAWAKEMQPTVENLLKAIRKYQELTEEPPSADKGVQELIAKGLLKKSDLQDLWGRELTVKPMLAWDPEHLRSALLISLGPDGRPGTLDDIIMATDRPGAWFPDEEAVQSQVMVFAAEGAPGGPGMMLGMAGGAMRGMDRMAVKAAPMPMAATAPRNGDDKAKPSVRVREYFPETLFFEPSLITDETGKATLTMPMADSITTWRLAAMANSALGQLGSTTKGIRCFQDFFVDIDLPVSLTQNDEVSIPIAVYNYLPGPQKVRLEMTKGDWFELKGEAVQTLEIAGNEVDVRYFTFQVKKIGDHPLTVHAYGSKMNDAIKRTIEVVPDGEKIEVTSGGRLRGTVEETIDIPKGAIAGASNILVKVYPGMFSQVVEGLDSMLRMPFGCFEQTSSVTWPNVMVLDYMKTTRQATPEIQMKAEGLINVGYQRLVSYEVAGGGFSWFGNAPANKLLTAYGLMLFRDMIAVHEVDEDIISRTQDWLLAQADDSGVYQPEKEYFHAETWSKVQVNELLPTAYAVWGLTHSGSRDPKVERSAAYVRKNWQKAAEPYSLSIVANGLVGADLAFNDGDLDDATRSVLKALVDMAKTEDDKMWWEANISGITRSTGKSADLEATGMAVLALLRSGQYSAETAKVLNYLVASKDENGNWQSTNATMLALRALVMAQKQATAPDTNGEVTVTVNGKQASGFALTPENADVMRLVDCKKLVKPGPNKVRIQFAGKGSTLYQVVGRHYTPWKRGAGTGVEPLAIDLKYDKTTLAKDDIITANVTVTNNTPGTTSMIIVDLGVPPGFAVDAGDFAELVGSKKIDRFTMTGRQVICYIEEMTPRQQIEFSYSLRAKFPLRAKTPKSTVYEYYNPDNRSDAAPMDIEVTG